MTQSKTLLARLWTGTGILATLATLLLSLPGVQAVRADDAPAVAATAAPSSPIAVVTAVGPMSCETPAGQADALTTLRDKIAAAEARAQAAAPAQGTARDRVVVLNNGGYNYGAPPAQPRVPVPPPAPASPR